MATTGFTNFPAEVLGSVPITLAVTSDAGTIDSETMIIQSSTGQLRTTGDSTGIVITDSTIKIRDGASSGNNADAPLTYGHRDDDRVMSLENSHIIIEAETGGTSKRILVSALNRVFVGGYGSQNRRITMYTRNGATLNDVYLRKIRTWEIVGNPSEAEKIVMDACGGGFYNFQIDPIDLFAFDVLNFPDTHPHGSIGGGNSGENAVWLWNPGSGFDATKVYLYDPDNELYIGWTWTPRIVDEDGNVLGAKVIWRDDRANAGTFTQHATYETNADGILVGTVKSQDLSTVPSQKMPTIWMLVSQAVIDDDGANPPDTLTKHDGSDVGESETYDLVTVQPRVEIRSYAHLKVLHFGPTDNFSITAQRGEITADGTVVIYEEVELTHDAGITEQTKATVDAYTSLETQAKLYDRMCAMWTDTDDLPRPTIANGAIRTGNINLTIIGEDAADYASVSGLITYAATDAAEPPEWIASKTYFPGVRVTYMNRYWQCIQTATGIPPGLTGSAALYWRPYHLPTAGWTVKLGVGEDWTGNADVGSAVFDFSGAEHIGWVTDSSGTSSRVSVDVASDAHYWGVFSATGTLLISGNGDETFDLSADKSTAGLKFVVARPGYVPVVRTVDLSAGGTFTLMELALIEDRQFDGTASIGTADANATPVFSVDDIADVSVLLDIGDAHVRARGVYSSLEQGFVTDGGLKYLAFGGARLRLVVNPAVGDNLFLPSEMKFRRAAASDANAAIVANVFHVDDTPIDNTNGNVALISGLQLSDFQHAILEDFDIDPDTAGLQSVASRLIAIQNRTDDIPSVKTLIEAIKAETDDLDSLVVHGPAIAISPTKGTKHTNGYHYFPTTPGSYHAEASVNGTVVATVNVSHSSDIWLMEYIRGYIEQADTTFKLKTSVDHHGAMVIETVEKGSDVTLELSGNLFEDVLGFGSDYSVMGTSTFGFPAVPSAPDIAAAVFQQDAEAGSGVGTLPQVLGAIQAALDALPDEIAGTSIATGLDLQGALKLLAAISGGRVVENPNDDTMLDIYSIVDDTLIATIPKFQHNERPAGATLP